MKFAMTATLVAASLLLAACGGGGGSGSSTPITNPPETPKATGSVSATPTSCTALEGTGACAISVSAETKNAPNGALATPAGSVSVVNTTYTAPVSVPVGVFKLELKNGEQWLADVSVTASCVPTTTLDPVSKKCVGMPVLTLTNKTTATLEGSAPIVVDVGVAGFSVTGTTASAVAKCDGNDVAMKPATLATAGGTVEFVPQSAWPAGTSCPYTVTATATNVAGTATKTLDGTFTAPKVGPSVVHYDRMNLIVSGELFPDSGNGTLAVGLPQLIVGMTLKPVKNETGVQVGGCMLSSSKLDNGLPAAWCVQPQRGNVRGVFPIHPDGRLLPEYTGTLPPGMVFYAAQYGNFGDSPYASFGVAHYGMFIDVPGGIYYYTNTGGEVRFTSDMFTTYTVVQSGQTYKVLTTYTNPAP